MFDEDWPRYVFKMATGAGKSKVLSLIIAWSFFHRLYEEGSTLSRNFLVIAPNIIVLDRLRADFELDITVDADAEQLWVDEAQRRYDAYQEGEVEARGGDEVMAKARNRLK